MAVADDVFLEAVRAGDLSAVGTLLEQGADINARTERGGAALMIAAKAGSLALVRLLLACGADMKGRDGRGWTALHDAVLAAHGGDTEVIPVLLEAGTDINAPNGRGQTPLIAAAIFGSLEAVRVLLAWGADAARRDEAGQTARSMTHGDDAIRRLLTAAAPGEEN